MSEKNKKRLFFNLKRWNNSTVKFDDDERSQPQTANTASTPAQVQDGFYFKSNTPTSRSNSISDKARK